MLKSFITMALTILSLAGLAQKTNETKRYQQQIPLSVFDSSLLLFAQSANGSATVLPAGSEMGAAFVSVMLEAVVVANTRTKAGVTGVVRRHTGDNALKNQSRKPIALKR